MQPAAGLPARLAAPPQLLGSLRDCRLRLIGRRGARVSIAVAERSELRAGGRQEAAPPALPGADALPQQHHQHPLPMEQQQLEATQDILQAFLAFEACSNVQSLGQQQQRLPRRRQQQHHSPPRRQPPADPQSDGPAPGAAAAGVESSRSRSRSSSGRRSTARSHAGGSSGGGSGAAAGAAQPVPQRGLQGRVVEHLLAGGFDEALLEPVPTHTLNWAIQVLGEQGQAVLAEQLFHWMRVKGRANQYSFAKFCRACCAVRQPWRALQAWRVTRRMPQAAQIMGSHAGAALVLCYRCTADHRGAAAALEDLLARGIRLDRYAWNAAIRVAADAGAAQEALRLLGRLRAAAAAAAAAAADQQQQQQQQQRVGGASSGGAGHSGSSDSGSTRPSGSSSSGRGCGAPGSSELRPDCRSYSAALAALAAAGQCGRAAQLHRWLREDGVRLDAPLCTQLLDCYGAAGQAGAAQALFDDMLAVGPLPNVSHWNALLAAYAQARDTAGCAAAYRRMLGAGRRPDASSFAALLRAAFLAGQGLEAVQAVRREMAAQGVQLNPRLGTAMLCCLRHVDPAAAAAAPPLHVHLRPDGAGAGCGSGSSEQRACQLSAAPWQRQQDAQQQQAHLSAALLVQPAHAPAHQQQHHQQGQQQQQQQGPPASLQHQVPLPPPPVTDGLVDSDERHHACLQEAAAVFAALRQQATRKRRPLDLLAFNALMTAQLAAGDHAGVMHTFGLVEAQPSLLPDATTLGTVIRACREAGWPELEAQYRQLLQSSRLLGTLDDHSRGSSSGSSSGGSSGREGRQRGSKRVW